MTLLALSTASCVGSERSFTPEQQAVFDAMQAWSRAVEQREPHVLWDLRSRNGQEYYRAELHEIRKAVSMTRAALEPESLITPQRRKELEEYLKTLPADADAMTPKQFHAWRLQRELTADRVEEQTRLFARANVEKIELDGELATATLLHGEPDVYYWRRESGGWKFDVMPSMLRKLEAGRKASE